MSSRVVTVLFGLAFSLPGIGLIGYVLSREAEGARVRREWAQVPAVVLKREHARFQHRGITRWRWTVRYAYEVDGRRCESNRLDLLYGSAVLLPKLSDHPRVAGYRPGMTATAHVDPADPTSAYLDPRVPYLGFFLAVGLIFVVWGGAVAVAPFRPSWTRAGLLVGLDLATVLLWIHPRLGTASISTFVVAVLLTLPAVVLTGRAVLRRPSRPASG